MAYVSEIDYETRNGQLIGTILELLWRVGGRKFATWALAIEKRLVEWAVEHREYVCTAHICITTLLKIITSRFMRSRIEYSPAVGTEIDEALLDAGDALLSLEPEVGVRQSFESLDAWYAKGLALEPAGLGLVWERGEAADCRWGELNAPRVCEVL